MSRPLRDAAGLCSPAELYVARMELVQKLGPLAASPLDEQVTPRMLRVLQGAQSSAVRRAVGRTRRPGEPRPPLVSIPRTADEAASGRRLTPPVPLVWSRRLTTALGREAVA